MKCSLVVAALVLAGCAATPRVPATAPPPPDPRIAELVALRDAPTPAAPEVARARLGEVEALLASPDPALRDGLGYTLLARWLVRDATLDDATVRELRDRLVGRLAISDGDDAVLGRSFAALALSLVAAREVAAPVWSDAELETQCAAAATYAAAEVDLRGYTGAAGWAHAAAHTSDWIKFLGRHPRLTEAQATRLLGAIADLAARRHGQRFSDGEDERMAAAVMSLVRRGALRDAVLDAWLARLAAPIALGWPEPFDPVLFRTQRNARDLLVSLFVALSFDDSAAAAAALLRVRALMTAV